MTDQTEKHSVSGEITLKDLALKMQSVWVYLLPKWKIIVGMGIICGVIGFLYAWSKKPVYKAQLTFALQDEKPMGLGGALGLASSLGFDLGGSAGGEFTGDNLLELMKSRNIIEKTLLTPVNVKNKQITLAEFYININNLRADWADKPELKNIHFPLLMDRSKFTLTQDSLLGVFKKNLLLSNVVVEKTDKKLDIISVNVTTANELFSKAFAEVLVKVVADYYVQTKTEKAAKSVAILQRQTDSVRRVLNGAITGVAVLTDVNPNPNPYLATLRAPSQHRLVDVQANTAILTQLVSNLELAKMALLQDTPLIQVIDSPILPLEKIKKSRLISLIVGGMIGSILSICFFLYKKFISGLDLK